MDKWQNPSPNKMQLHTIGDYIVDKGVNKIHVLNVSPPRPTRQNSRNSK